MSVIFDIINSREWRKEDIRNYEILTMIIELDAVQLNNMDILFRGDREFIKLLLQTNINLSSRDGMGRTLVHILAMNSNPGVIEQLRDKHFDVNLRDNFGSTPLMIAAQSGNANAVEFFLNEGADIEAPNNRQETALYLAISRFILRGRKDKFRLIVQVLLEYGANAQIETDKNDKTIFDLILRYVENLALAELPLAQLALQEALGTAITDLIRSKIDSNQHFKTYFEFCQQQLSIEIHSKITLLDVLLAANEQQLERFFRNKESASKLIDFKTTIDYFDTILRKRFAKANRMVELRKTAAPIICELMKTINYDRYPCIADHIVSYLEEQDIQFLISIENEASSANADNNEKL